VLYSTPSTHDTLALKFGEQRVEDLDQHVWEGVLLEILAIQVNALCVRGDGIAAVMKKQGLPATATAEHCVILPRCYIAQHVGDIDIGYRFRSSPLYSQILVNCEAKLLELIGVNTHRRTSYCAFFMLADVLSISCTRRTSKHEHEA